MQCAPEPRIADLQEKSRRTFQRLGVPQHNSVLTYFHGLGLSHADVLALVGGRRRSQLDVGRGHGDSCSPSVSGR